jgi:elongator complex protein 1
MAFYILALKHEAIDVAFSESGSRLAVLSNTDVALYELNLNKRPVPKPTLLWKSDAFKSTYPRHVAFVGDEQLFCVTDNWDENESCLWRSEGTDFIPRGPIIEAEGISSLLSDVDYKALFVQFQSGALHQLDTTEESQDLPPQTSLLHKFSSLAPEVKVVTVEGQVCARTLIASEATDITRHWLLV